MKYFCVLFNEDCSNIIKYYCSERLDKLYYNLSTYSKFINIYEIEQTDKYKLKNIKYDKIISIFCKDEKYIKIIETIYNKKLKYLREIQPFVLKNNFINYRAIDILDVIIKYEFKELGLNVIKYDEKDIIELNNKTRFNFNEIINKKKNKYELLLIKNISKKIM